MEAVARGVENRLLWPEVRESDQIRRLFPKTADELAAFTDKSISEIQDAFRKVVQIPSAHKDFENTFYAIDFARAVGECNSHVLQVVVSTHTLFEVRNVALVCLNRLQGVLVKYKGDKELYQACLFARTNQGHSQDKIQIMEEMLKGFEREGAHLNMEEWARCVTLKKEINQIETAFLKNLDEDDTSIWVLKSDLFGVPKKVIDAFEKRGDFCHVPCDTNTYFSVVSFCDIEKTRKRIYLAYNKRTYQKNLPLLQELIKKRAELARLLNFKSYAHFDISNQLAKTPETAQVLLDRLDKVAKVCAEKELSQILNTIPGNFLTPAKGIQPWNMSYLYALGRGEICQEDDEDIRQYFPLYSTFPKILNYLSDIFRLSLKPIFDPIWEGANIRVEVRDEKQVLLGHILYDLYPRKGKYGHAICYDVVPPIIINGVRTLALAAVVINLTPPTIFSSALLTYDELSTLMHETGHALHLVLGACEMPTKAGYRTPTDFLELPALLMENLIYEPNFIKSIGQHHSSLELIKDSALKNRKISKGYAAGYILQAQTALSQLSLDLFCLADGYKTTEVRERIYKRIMPVVEHVENLHYEATFRHLVDPLYGSKYYGVLYAIAYSAEVYAKIVENPKLEWFRFRKAVLEKGGKGNPLDHLAVFLGKIPSINVFLNELKPA